MMNDINFFFIFSSSDFIMKVAEETGIILDPVYTGKAVYCLVKQLINNPEQFKGNKILYIHTGRHHHNIFFKSQQ